jgi:hypothetical protein
MKSKTRIAVKKSIIKARIITGTLVLQKDRHRFNKFDISSQGWIQVFKLGGGGAHLKKNCAERREALKFLGYFV